ncbi:hypothetical protein HPB50_008423 [Hyalomma asiaticum]|uniref:Uncharacterized protein n=1 Tax=Hyalomma asiaticum TaxID=266040 RepID=A0ACB7RZG1_HYAAI|nr:hypothetical protein HPB50_008423 [Hyalomma asiaticum]
MVVPTGSAIVHGGTLWRQGGARNGNLSGTWDGNRNLLWWSPTMHLRRRPRVAHCGNRARGQLRDLDARLEWLPERLLDRDRDRLPTDRLSLESCEISSSPAAVLDSHVV